DDVRDTKPSVTRRASAMPQVEGPGLASRKTTAMPIASSIARTARASSGRDKPIRPQAVSGCCGTTSVVHNLVNDETREKMVNADHGARNEERVRPVPHRRAGGPPGRDGAYRSS